MKQDNQELDISLLDEMASLGIEDLRDLIEVYIGQATSSMQEICDAIDANVSEEVSQLAHRLAGSCAACGVPSAMNALRALERDSNMGDWNAVKLDFRQAIEKINSSSRLLAEYLDEKNIQLHVKFEPPKQPQHCS